MSNQVTHEGLGKLKGLLDRREFLRLASAMGLGLGAGFSVPAISVAATATGQPKRGGTLKFPVDANVTPWPPIGLLQNLLVNKSMFNCLLRYRPEDWSPEPDLAEKWETSKDGLTWTFSLRKDVRWHDGKPFTAEDVKFTLDLFRDPKVASSFRG
ncbi:MAG TPA: ABC transporter substrate-binding protein, partial [Candidatus Methylomirabilis sp.]|nr:ABC transporter substrate-binding protein [Candidatus Methylomirabilis sp.]